MEEYALSSLRFSSFVTPWKTSDPAVGSLRPVLAALVKYQMDGIRSGWIKGVLRAATETEPWGVYATALTWVESAATPDDRRGQTSSKDDSPTSSRRWPAVKELSLITGVEYHRVMQYYTNCRTRLANPSTFDRISRTLVQMGLVQGMHISARSLCTGRVEASLRGSCSPVRSIQLVNTYRSRVKAAIEKQPCGQVVEDTKLWLDLILDSCPAASRKPYHICHVT